MSEGTTAVPHSIAPGVIEIDTLLGGWQRVTAGYLIEGPAPVLVETGSQSSVPVRARRRSAGLGLGPGDLAGVAVTHIHLDHAGGVGDVARAFPKATVYVHEKGARHLADPTRLVALGGPGLRAAARLPLRPARPDPRGADPRARRRRGDRRSAPGRSSPPSTRPATPSTTSGCTTPTSGILFVGDAVGRPAPRRRACCARRPRRRTSTSTRRCTRCTGSPTGGRARSRSPTTGSCSRPDDVLAEAEGMLRQWAETAELAYRAGEDIAEALARRFDPRRTRRSREHREKFEVMNGVHSNAAGLQRWLENRDRPKEA